MSVSEFQDDIQTYNLLNRDKDFDVTDEHMYPIFTDKYANNGGGGDFFAGPIWIANKVFRDKPAVHIDIGSRFEALIANLLSFRQNTIFFSTGWKRKRFMF